MRRHWRPVIAASTGNACARSANAAYESNGSELVLRFHGACSTAITAYDKYNDTNSRHSLQGCYRRPGPYVRHRDGPIWPQVQGGLHCKACPLAYSLIQSVFWRYRGQDEAGARLPVSLRRPATSAAASHAPPRWIRDAVSRGPPTRTRHFRPHVTMLGPRRH